MFAKDATKQGLTQTGLVLSSILGFASLGVWSVQAQDKVDFNSGIALEYVNQTVDDVNNASEIDSDNIIIRPFLAATYTGRDLQGFVRATHNHVRRSLEDEDVTNNFTNFAYGGRFDIVQNVLALQANGSQSYNSQAAQSFLVDDFLLNADNLRKNTNNSVGLLLNIPTGDYFGLNSRLSANKFKSDRSEEQNQSGNAFQNFDNTSYTGQVALESGTDFRPFFYNLDISANRNERDAAGDFESQRANLRLGSAVYEDFSVRVLGYYENNEISNEIQDDQASALREFYSYGLGVAWQPSQNRFIELGFNRSTTKSLLDEEDDKDDYLSLDMSWAFSLRTQVSANYSRRFFGDSARFQLSHNLRNWRTSVSYNEDVTTNSQLFFNQEDGLLVCSNGSSNISDCRLSDGIEDQDLSADEILVPITVGDFELNDRVVIRKAWTAQTAVDLRRTTLSASLTKSKNEEQEIQRDLDIFAGQLRLSVNISPRSTLALDASYTDIDRLQADSLGEDSIIKEAGIRFERRMTRRLFTSIGYRYLDRDGAQGIGGGGIQGIQGPLTDRRISAEIRYEFNRSN